MCLATEPGTDTHWAQYFFPLPATPVESGDILRVRLAMEREEPTFSWRWQGEVLRAGTAVMTFDMDSDPRWGERDSEARPAIAVDSGDAWDANERGAEAFREGDYMAAAHSWEQATSSLASDEPGASAPIWENLGIAYCFLGRFPAAIRAFLRALDGKLSSREQSLRLLVRACRDGGHPLAAERYARLYVATFGRLPEPG